MTAETDRLRRLAMKSPPRWLRAGGTGQRQENEPLGPDGIGAGKEMNVGDEKETIPGLLVWHEVETGKEWEAVSAVEAEEGCAFQWRVRRHGQKYQANGSSSELIGGGCSLNWDRLEWAQEWCQETEREIVGDLKAEDARDAAVGEPAGAPSLAAKEFVMEPEALPIPRPSDVSVSAIEVVHNVRGPAELFDAEALARLGDSLEKHQNETVKLMRLPGGRFRLLDGERRYRAAVARGMATLRAEVYDRELTEAEILWFQLTTFATRADLTHGQWGASLADYQRAQGGITPAEIARRLGLSDDHVRKHLAYAELRAEVRELVDGERLSLNKALVIARLPADLQAEWGKRCWLQGWSEADLTARVTAEAGKGGPGPLIGGSGSGSGSGFQPLSETAGDRPTREELEARCDGDETPDDVAPGELGSSDDAAGTESVERGMMPRLPAEAADAAKPTPPADNAWKAKPVWMMGMSAKVSDALKAAGLWCAGLVAEFQGRHGVNWTREITGIGEAAAGEVDAAFERLWIPASPSRTPATQDKAGDGPTDEHDRTNQRRVDRINQAPIRGTKGDTAREREEQARRDSDAASQAEKSPAVSATVKGRTANLVVSVAGTRSTLEAGVIELDVTIAGKPYVARGSLKMDVEIKDGKRLLVAACKTAGKATAAKAGKAAARKR